MNKLFSAGGTSGTARSDYHSPLSEESVAGTFCLSYHFEMLSDNKRVDAFRRAIALLAKDQVVLESGTGSGIMSLLAAQAEARCVYATEIDEHIAEIAAANFERSSFRDRITLRKKSTFDLTLDDLEGQLPGLIIAENLSTWCVTEPQIQIMNYLNENIQGAHTRVIPARVINQLELAYTNFSFADVVTFRTYYFQFSGIAAPQVLSQPITSHEWDLHKENELDVNIDLSVRVDRDGILNCVRLTSPLWFGADISFDSSDSLMPPVVVPLDRDIQVRAGQEVKLNITYSVCSSWEKFRVRLIS